MDLKDLILTNIAKQETVEKLAEQIRDDLVNNMKLSDKEYEELNNNLEVIKLNDNSCTLLADYPNLETAIQEVLEKEIINNIEESSHEKHNILNSKNQTQCLNKLENIATRAQKENETLKNTIANSKETIEILAKKLNKAILHLNSNYKNGQKADSNLVFEKINIELNEALLESNERLKYWNNNEPYDDIDEGQNHHYELGYNQGIIDSLKLSDKVKQHLNNSVKSKNIQEVA